MENSTQRAAYLFTVVARRRAVGLLLAAGFFSVQAVAQSGLANSSWPVFRHDGHLTARAAINGPSLPEIKWTTEIGAGQLGSPTVGPDGTIYVPGNVEDNLYALDPNGRLKWIFRPAIVVPTDPFVAAPVVGSDGTIYLGSTTNVVYAVNPDGTERWHVELDGAILHSANIGSDGTIYVVAQDCRLYAIAPEGRIKWRQDLHGFPMNAPAIAPFGWIIVVAGEFLEAFRADGTPQWFFSYGDMGEIHGLMADDSKNLYITSRKSQQVRAIKKSNGATVWTYSLPAGFGSPSLPALGKDGRIYFAGSKGGRLFALNNNGIERWSFTLSGTKYLSEPIVDDSNHVYVVNDKNGLMSISAEGKLRWSLPEVRCDFSPAFGADGTIYVAADQKLFAVGLQSRRPSSLKKDSGDGQTGCIDSTLAEPLRVRVNDQFGNPVSGQKVDFRVISGGGRLSAAQVRTNSAGIAEARWTLGPNLGKQEVEAASEGTNGSLQGSPTRFTAEASGPQIGGESEVAFGTTAVKQFSRQTYIIRNNSQCTLRIDSLKIIDEVNPSFFVLDTVRDSLIAPGESVAVRLQFAPLVSGSHADTLRIFNNDPVRSPFDVKLVGAAVDQPLIAVDPESLDFGNVRFGDSTTRTLKIFNIGTADLQITNLVIEGANVSDFSILSGSEGPPIPPAGSREVTLQFAPADTGSRNADLLIFSNDPVKNPLTVPLKGRGFRVDGPDIEVRPGALVFETVCLDSADTDTLTISNVGTDTLEVFSLAGLSSPFSIRPAELLPWRIASGESKQAFVDFSPTDTLIQADTLLIFSNDPDENPLVVSLHGEGIAPQIKLVADPPQFGDICVGQSTVTNVTIFNLSDQCVLKAVVETAIIFPDVPSHLAPEYFLAQTLSDTFFIQPEDSLALPAFRVTRPPRDFIFQVIVWSNAPTSPDTLEVPGRVIPPVIASVDSVKFGEVLVGQSKPDSALVSNAGKCLVSINSLEIIGKDSKAFELGVIDLPTTLEVGQSVKIPLTFKPTRSGVHTATLLVFNNDPNPERDTLRVQLHGIGIDVGLKQPDIEIAPLALDFGAVCRDSLLNTVVSNKGDTTLRVDSLVFSNPSVFSTDHPVPFMVEPSQNETIRIRFSPESGKVYNDTLWIYSNDPDENPVVVSMQGKGGVPDIDGLTEVVFDTVEVQTCAGNINDTTQTYVIHNVGECDLKIDTLVTSGDFSVVSGNGMHLVKPGDSLKVLLKFTPGGFGDRNGSLQISSNDPDEPTFSAALRGHGLAAPDIAVVPDTLDFGEVEEGSSKDSSITITNFGALVLRVDSLVISDALRFSTKTDTFTLSCNRGSVVAITFKPDAVGSFEATLSIWSNDPNERPVIVVLRGRGKAKEAVIAVDPDPLIFPAVCLGEDTIICVTVKNIGTAPLVVQNPSVSPIPIFTTEAEEFVLQPGDSVRICIAFTPADTLEYRGTLTLISNAINSPKVVELVGRGVAPRISGAREAVFSDTRVGSTDTVTYIITGDMMCELVVDSLWITGTNAAEFDADSLIQPLTIAPGSNGMLELRFTPKAIGERTAQLNLRSNDPRQQPFVVQLRGNGVTGALEVRGSIAAVCPGDSSINEYTLRNVGKAYLRIDSISLGSGDYFSLVKSLPMGTILTPGDSRTIQVKFKPGVSGQFADTLLIPTNLPPDRTYRIALDGVGLEEIPIMAITEPQKKSIVFPNGRLDKTLGPETITIKNVGCVPLVIRKMKLEERDSTVFSYTSEHLLPYALEKGESMKVEVWFTGDNYRIFRDTLNIFSNDPFKNPERVGLEGNVTDGDPCLLLADSELDFGEVVIGQSKSMPLHLTNTSNDSRVIIESIWTNLPEKDYSVDNKSLLILPLNTQTLTVTFTPKARGDRLDTLYLKTNISGFEPSCGAPLVKIPLRGVGTGKRIYALPNAFTPNGDGKNDSAKIHFPGFDELITPALRIYDLRGLAVRTIQRSSNRGFVIGWDGRDESGRLLLPGAYLWLLEDNGKKVGSGQIVLIR